MEISTTLKITLEEIKQMLADKHGIKHSFELQIIDFDGTKLSSSTDQVEAGQTKETPWYPDDSGEWVEIEIGKGKPVDLPDSCLVDILTVRERKAQKWESMPERASTWGFTNTVAYKKVK